MARQDIINGEQGLNVRNAINAMFTELYGIITKGANIAGASTIDLSTATGNYLHITGSSWTATSLGTVSAGSFFTLVFDGVGTLTYNATSLILPGAANITTAAGDSAVFRSEGSGNWQCVSYLTSSNAYTAYTPTVTGFSTSPVVSGRYIVFGKMCHVEVQVNQAGASGTSNATTFTLTLPFTASTNDAQVSAVSVLDNGTWTVGHAKTSNAGSNVLTITKLGFNAFTSSGQKGTIFNFTFETN